MHNYVVFGQFLVCVLFGRTENLNNELGCVSSSEGKGAAAQYLDKYDVI